DGGRLKWEKEGRPLTREVPQYAHTTYEAPERDDKKIRTFRDQVLVHMEAGKPLVDVRSPQEFSGERTHMPEYPQEGVLRGGHIPGAKNVPWARASNPEDGTFKSAIDLRAIYEREQGLKPTDEVVAYCRIGERSSHTWFVLTYLLGDPRPRGLRRPARAGGRDRSRIGVSDLRSRGVHGKGPGHDRNARSRPVRGPAPPAPRLIGPRALPATPTKSPQGPPGRADN